MARVSETHDSREEAMIERERDRFVNGEIGLSEFEDRVDAILDPDRKPPLHCFGHSTIMVV